MVRLALHKEGSNNMTQAEPTATLPGSGAETGQDLSPEAEPLGDDPADQLANGNEDVEGLDSDPGWDDYPLDALLIRNEVRTIHNVIRRIDQGT